jgi:hypothetical protein
LIRAGVLSQTQVEEALAKQRSVPGWPKLGEVILAMDMITEETLLDVLARSLRMPSIDLAQVTPTREALRTVSTQEARRHLVVPIRMEREGHRQRLVLAMADPTNVQIVDELQFKTGMIVRPVVATARQVRRVVSEVYGIDITLPPLAEMDPTGHSPDASGPSSDDTWVDSPAHAHRQRSEVAELRVVSGTAKGRVVHITQNGALAFGRGEKVDVSFPDMRMSRRHFILFDTGTGIELIDLGSANGTTVNQEKVRRALLKTGDFIQAGDTILQVSLRGRPRA